MPQGLAIAGNSNSGLHHSIPSVLYRVQFDQVEKYTRSTNQNFVSCHVRVDEEERFEGNFIERCKERLNEYMADFVPGLCNGEERVNHARRHDRGGLITLYSTLSMYFLVHCFSSPFSPSFSSQAEYFTDLLLPLQRLPLQKPKPSMLRRLQASRSSRSPTKALDQLSWTTIGPMKTITAGEVVTRS